MKINCTERFKSNYFANMNIGDVNKMGDVTCTGDCESSSIFNPMEV